jgi:hypothetical protein
MPWADGDDLTPTNLNNTVPTWGSGVGGAILVAANDSPAFLKTVANYTCDGTADDVEWQAAVDEAQTYVVGALGAQVGAPEVIILPGSYFLSSTVIWKSAPIRGTFLTPSVRVTWTGAAGGTVLDKDVTFGGGSSFGELAYITFTEDGGTTPGTWVDITGSPAPLDSHLNLHNLVFNGATDYAVKITSPTNAHWRKIRFQDCVPYAIKMTPPSGAFLGSFRLENWTYDHSLAASPASGIIEVDSTANSSNLGVLELCNGRIEVNTTWTGEEAIVKLTVPDSSANARVLGLHIANMSFQAGAGSPVILYRDTADTSGSESLSLTNFRQSGLNAVTGGTWPSWWADPPLVGAYGHLSYNLSANNNNTPIMANGLDITQRNDSNHHMLKARQMGDTQDRVRIAHDGAVLTGDGSTAPVQVLSTRVVDARLADTPNSGDATTDGLIDALRDLIISHGLGASS